MGETMDREKGRRRGVRWIALGLLAGLTSLALGCVSVAEFRKLHYFAVSRWEGVVESHEAAALRWVSLTASRDLDLDVDRLALAEYLRVYGDV